MTDYPVMLRLAGRRCVVVGAGPVGLRKAAGLLDAGARVVLIDPDLKGKDLSPHIEAFSRHFIEEDFEGAFLVFAATNDPEANEEIAVGAKNRSIPVSIADNPAISDFVLPASFQKGDLVISVATGGVSPAVAAMVRDDIHRLLPDEWQIFLEIAGNLRSRLLTSSSKAAYNQQVLQNLVSSDILAMINNADGAGIDRLLESEFGKGFSLADLGICLSKGSS